MQCCYCLEIISVYIRTQQHLSAPQTNYCIFSFSLPKLRDSRGKVQRIKAPAAYNAAQPSVDPCISCRPSSSDTPSMNVFTFLRQNKVERHIKSWGRGNLTEILLILISITSSYCRVDFTKLEVAAPVHDFVKPAEVAYAV